MKNKKNKVLFVATSRKTMGGIASVLKMYEKMDIWRKYHCAWLETQIDKGRIFKLWYMLKAYITMLFIVPQYNIIHFHTVPGRSMTVQMPVFLYALLWRKKTIIHIHIGNNWLEHTTYKQFKYVLRKATKVVVLANVIKELMKEKYNIDAEVLYNPIELQPKRDNTKLEKTIFFAAILRKHKGYDTLLKAFKKVLVTHPDWKLIIAGSGNTEDVTALIKDLEIGDNVIMHKWLDKNQMKKIYSTTSIFCIASKLEGFPMTFLEAGSYGIPIVTTPVGGLVDVIDHGVNCMQFDFDNHDDMANQIIALIENDNLRCEISNNITTLIASQFSTTSVDREIDNLYMKILNRN